MWNSRPTCPSMDELRRILSFVDYSDRETWYKVTIAVGRSYHQSPEAFHVVQEWASQYPHRKANDAKQERAEYFQSSLRAGGADIGYVINLAKSNGYKPTSSWSLNESKDLPPEPGAILEKPIIISQETVESQRELASVESMEDLAASVCNYLIVSATDDERKAILAKYSSYSKFFPKEHGMLLNILNDFCRSNREFNSLAFKNWLLALNKGFTEESYLSILSNGSFCSYSTCIDFLAEIKVRYNRIYLSKVCDQIKALSDADDFDAAAMLLHSAHYKFFDSEQVNIYKTEDLCKLNDKDIQESIDPELSKNLYVKSGIKEFDNAFKGWRIGEMSIGAGHSGVGKSWMMITLALKAAESGQKSLIISTEMSAQTLANRLFREAMQINEGDYNKHDMLLQNSKVFNAKLQVLDKITVVDGRNISASMIDTLIEQWRWENSDGKLVFVDYLQNISNDGFGNINTPSYERILNTSKQLSYMAQNHNCAIVVLAQLNNPNRGGRSDSTEQGVYKMPNLYDLSGSTGVVCDAAVVFLMYNIVVKRESTSEAHSQNSSIKMRYGIGEKGKKETLVKIDVVKTRYGCNGPASFTFRRTRGGGFASDKTPGIYWGEH